jgi:glycerol uptake facilitator-like aquaporin
VPYSLSDAYQHADGTYQLGGACFIMWTVFQWQEGALDEREELHRFLAARLAYFVGAAIVMIGVLVQSLRHSVDPWLVGALIGMIVAKVVSRGIAEKYN